MALTEVYVFIAVTILSIVQSHGLESHLICKSVQDVFSLVAQEPLPPGLTRGPAGKRGVPGVKGEEGRPGEKGDKGSPAIVNYQRIEQVIERKTIEPLSCIQNGGYLTNKNCYYVIIYASTNRRKAFQLCEDIGSKPADIHNMEEQNRITSIARSKLSSTVLQFWIGMTYQSSTNTLFLSNGTVVSSNFAWYPGYPQRRNSQSNMFVEIRSSVASVSQGIFNYLASHTTGGVICMKPLTDS